MNTAELEETLWQDPKVRSMLGGVFPCDRLPNKILSSKRIFIANTHPASRKGEHWVAFYFPPQGKCIYFDSFGLPPIIPSFVDFMEKNAKNWTYNSKRLQDFNSNVCGHYCLLFAYYMARRKPLHQMLKLFDKRTHINDKKVVDFLNIIYPAGKQRRLRKK